MDWKRHIHSFAGFVVFVVACAVYANSLGNGFVGTDHSVIVNNPVLRGNPLSVFSAIDTTSELLPLPYYRPLTYLSFLLEGRLHDFTPQYVRFFNIVLHAANAWLVYRLALGLFGSPPWALLVGLLFAVHPIHAEGVDFNAGGRNTMLACFFALSAILLHRKSIARNSTYISIAGALALLAGLLSKEVAFMALPLMVFQEVAASRTSTTYDRRQFLVRLLQFAAVTLSYMVLRWVVLYRHGMQESILPGLTSQYQSQKYVIPSLAERLAQNLYVIPKNLWNVAWPTQLSSRYVVPQNLDAMVVVLAVTWVAIVILLGWLLTKGRSGITLFGLAWLIVFWLPVSGIISFSNVPLADRFLYIPLIGLWIVIVDQLSRCVEPVTGIRKTCFWVAAAFVLSFFAVVTFKRNLDWRSDMTLYAKLVEQYPDNYFGHYNLGSSYVEKGSPRDLEVAEIEYEKALALAPDMQQIYIPLGYLRMKRNDYQGAVQLYDKALKIEPLDRDARINRGLALMKLGRKQEALEDFRFYLTIPTHNNVPGSQEFAEQMIQELSK